jgi:hypothetical protein
MLSPADQAPAALARRLRTPGAHASGQGHVGGSLNGIRRKTMNIKDFKNLDKNDILEMLGMRSESTTSSVLRTISLIAMGVVAGATVARSRPTSR